MGRKKDVNMKMIAKALGVSVVTVSNALNGRKGVSAEKKEEILQKARELGYKMVERSDSALKKRPAHLIGCIVAGRFVTEYPSFYMEIYKNIAREAGKLGSMTMLEVITPEMESRDLTLPVFKGSQIDGIVMIGELRRSYVNHIAEKYADTPIVCVDDYDVREDIDYVVTDSFGGMESVTRLLLEQGLNDLIFVGTVGATDSITDCYLGFCKALERRGISPDIHAPIPDRIADQLITPELPDELPQGFVCNCDRTAFEVIRILRNRGIRVPEDVSVAGFDNYPRDSAEGIRLTTYCNDEKVVSQQSLHILFNRIEKKVPPQGVRIIGGSVVRGESIKYRRQSKHGGH